MNIVTKIQNLKTSAILLMILFGGAFCSTKLVAQISDSSRYSMEYVKMSNPWLTSYNASGLQNLPLNNISEVSLSTIKKDGKLINYYESPKSYTLGAQAESYYHLSTKVVLYGKISYTNFKGKEMGGSTFIDPYKAPFDIVEYADSTRGNKNLEQYNLVGGISTQIYKGLIVGGKIDYTTANYAKQKDLRHVNKLLDLKASVGISYKLNNTFELGANYYYGRRIEDMYFSMHGNTDRDYVSLISFGSFMGKSEQFGEFAAFTPSKSLIPMVDERHGVSLQIGVNVIPNLSVFNELTYKSRSGYYGERGTTAVVRTEHNSKILEYSGTLSLKKEETLHSLVLATNYEDLDNYENVYQKETEPGEATHVIYYGRTEALNMTHLNVNVSYVANLGVSNFNPKWVLGAELGYLERKQITSQYPFFRKQTISHYNINLSAKHNIIRQKNMYSIFLRTLYTTGDGIEKEDGQYTTPAANQIPPRTLDRLLLREYEYLTASRIGGNVGFRYSRLFNSDVNAYMEIKYSYERAPKVKYMEGNSFTTIGLTLGCVF